MACGSGGGYRAAMNTQERSDARRRASALTAALGAMRSARSWRATLHALLGLPLGLGACTVLAGLVVVWGAAVWSLVDGPTGAPVLAVVYVLVAVASPLPLLWCVQGFGAVQRARFRAVLGVEIAAPPSEAGSWPLRPVRPWRAPATWRQLGYHLLALVIGTVGGALVATCWSAPALAVAYAAGAWGGGPRPGQAGRRPSPWSCRANRDRRGLGPAPRRPDQAARRRRLRGRRRRVRRRTPPHRARPPRRRATATGLPGDAPRHGARQPRRRARAGQASHRAGPRRSHHGPHRAARLRPRPAPGRARRPRSRRGPLRDRGTRAVPGPAARRGGQALLAEHRGRRLLRRLRGAHQRRQARRRRPGRGHRRTHRRAAAHRRQRRRPRWRDPGGRQRRRAARAGAAGRRGGRDAGHPQPTRRADPGGPTTITVELPCES